MLYLQLLENMAFIALALYIYNQTNLIRNLIKEDLNLIDKIIMVIFFASISILGTYIGIDVKKGAIANTRPIGAIVAGYVGGPLMGLTVGLIAGMHRYSLGGFTALSCAISTVVEGIIGGLGRKIYKNNELSVKGAFFSALVAEILQMIIVLSISKPYENAMALEEVIGLPMIIVNSLGVGVFINMIKNARKEYRRIEDIRAKKVLYIAKRTLNYMRKGFNKDTAESIVKIIYETESIEGVFIGDKAKVLAYCGKEEINHEIALKIEAYYKEPENEILTFKNNNKIICFYCVPIYVDNKFEGVLGVRVKEKHIDKYFMESYRELSELLATQIELYKLNNLAKQAYVAQLKALRSQIHPHFLFNALNTISSFCRSNPIKAKELIINLSSYFRITLKKEEDYVSLKEELDLVDSYVNIEKARFGDRLNVYKEIPSHMNSIKIPSFILQPLVENSIKHGILNKLHGGNIYIKLYEEGEKIKFSVEDTGVGIPSERYLEITQSWPGIGLKNINERLKLLYGSEYGINIESNVNVGTIVSFFIPKEGVV